MMLTLLIGNYEKRMTNYELRITNQERQTTNDEQRATNNEQRLTRTGFTLIELIVVIFIISLTASIVMPSLWGSGDRSLKSEAKRMGNTMRYIYDEAVSKKQIYSLKIDIENNTWSFESKGESRSFQAKDGVMFKDIIVPSHGEISKGELTLIFGPLGPEEPITLHLFRDEAEYTVKFNHLNGRAKVLEGYII